MSYNIHEIQWDQCLGTTRVSITSQDGVTTPGILLLASSSSSCRARFALVHEGERDKKEISSVSSEKGVGNPSESTNLQTSQQSGDLVWSLDDHDQGSLYVILTDGTSTFMTLVDFSHLKMTSEQMQHNGPIDWFAQTVLHSQGQSSNDFMLPSCSETKMTKGSCPVFTTIDADCIRLDMKHTHSDIVRVVLSLDIRRVSQSSLPFATLMSRFLSESMSTVKSFQSQVDQVVKERDEWKDTAEKLCTKHWIQEREDLMKRFLVLLNGVKGDLRTTNDKFNEERQRYNVLLERYKQQEMKWKENRGNDVLVDHEDEHDDINLFQEDEVERLAKGLRVDGPFLLDVQANSKKRKFEKNEDANHMYEKAGSSITSTIQEKNANGKESTKESRDEVIPITKPMNQSSQMTESKVAQEKRTRKNPLTGSLEIWNIEDMFSDSSNE